MAAFGGAGGGKVLTFSEATKRLDGPRPNGQVPISSIISYDAAELAGDMWHYMATKGIPHSVILETPPELPNYMDKESFITAVVENHILYNLYLTIVDDFLESINATTGRPHKDSIRLPASEKDNLFRLQAWRNTLTYIFATYPYLKGILDICKTKWVGVDFSNPLADFATVNIVYNELVAYVRSNEALRNKLLKEGVPPSLHLRLSIKIGGRRRTARQRNKKQRSGSRRSKK